MSNYKSPLLALVDQLWNHGDEVDALFAERFGEAIRKQAAHWDDTVAWTSKERQGVEMCIDDIAGELSMIFSKPRVLGEAPFVDVTPEQCDLAVSDLQQFAEHETKMTFARLVAARDIWRTRAKKLYELINQPHIDDFIEGLKIEAAYQSEKWSQGDADKDDAHWFWTLGWLAGKAIHGVRDKQLHHIVAAAALCFNWFQHRVGSDISKQSAMVSVAELTDHELRHAHAAGVVVGNFLPRSWINGFRLTTPAVDENA